MIPTCTANELSHIQGDCFNNAVFFPEHRVETLLNRPPFYFLFDEVRPCFWKGEGPGHIFKDINISSCVLHLFFNNMG